MFVSVLLLKKLRIYHLVQFRFVSNKKHIIHACFKLKDDRKKGIINVFIKQIKCIEYDD